MDRVVVNCPDCSLGHNVPVASQGDVRCQGCGNLFYADTRTNGDTAAHDPKRLLAAAEAGDAEACFDVGCGYTHGQLGFPQNRELARQWLMRSTELSPKNLSEIAMWIMDGSEPFERDEARALAMLQTAAVRGDEYGRLKYAVYTRDTNTLIDLASSQQYFRSRLNAAMALLGANEGGKYNSWTVANQDPAERKRLLSRRLDPKSSQGIFSWSPPWLKA